MNKHDILTAKRVLLVDDMSTIRKALTRMLDGFGMAVSSASDAETALMLMADQDVDVFLLDIHLAGMDGIELCRRLRRFERFAHTPVLFITGLVEDEVSQRAFDAGADDVISKPVSEAVLRARLNNHLQRAEYARELDVMRRSLNQYVDSRTRKMVEEQVREGKQLVPQRREICVLFSDVRGFTQLSQEMPPETLFRILSESLNSQVQCVYRFGGYIDKFSGDGVMAVFDGPDKSINSCLCALKMIEEACVQASGDAAGLYQLGIGIHQGEAMIGNIGIEKQLDYTVIGPTVNLAARLCG
ncbi:MAG TPA: adenylate/guanylate cyclase domain-containing response regulator, partial [Candidatus Tenderia electrophaga]|nr:adenylate/guanylate cyclase domain-containing response regulator [Candidatus Tenderia electrophaga]